MGPLLFIIFINDFERCFQGATPNIYADDTDITCSSTAITPLQRDIDIEMANVAGSMRQNSSITDKSEFTIIGHSRQRIGLNGLKEIEVTQKK